MQNLLIAGAIVIVLAGGYFGGSLIGKNKEHLRMSGFGSRAPEDNADLRGIVKSVEEGKIVVGKFKETDRNAQRDRFRNMSQEERNQMRSQRPNQDVSQLEETTINTNENTKYLKSTRNQDSSTEEEISINDISEGENISVWLTEDKSSAETVIIRNSPFSR